MTSDPYESKNLATDPAFADILEKYKALLKAKQKELHDPWVMKWEYE